MKYELVAVIIFLSLLTSCELFKENYIDYPSVSRVKGIKANSLDSLFYHLL